MKVTSKHKENLFFSITGLPGSGTTLMSRIMNSIDGSASLSDPMRSMLSINLKNNKLEEYDFKNPIVNFINGYKSYVKHSSRMEIGGIKETFSSIPSRINNYINRSFNQSDFIIFVIRNPLGNYNDWKRDNDKGGYKRLGNHILFNMVYDQYIKFYKKMKEEKPCFLIKYEDLCDNFSTEWLNSIFNGYLEFEGDLEKLKPLMGVGDDEAKYSYRINESYNGIENLSHDEVINVGRLESSYETIS